MSRTPSFIVGTLNLLEINRHTARKCIRQIEFRWSKSGHPNLQRVRSESKRRLHLINRELWQFVDSPETTDRIWVLAFSRLLQVHDRLLLVDGVTAAMLAESGRSYPMRCDADFSPEMSPEERIQEHQRLIELASKMQSFLRGQAQAEDQEPCQASCN